MTQQIHTNTKTKTKTKRQKVDGSSKRQAGCPESKGRNGYFYLTQKIYTQTKTKTKRQKDKKETALQNAKLDAQRVKNVRPTYC